MKIKNADLYAVVPFFNSFASCRLTVSQTVKNATVINRINATLKIIEQARSELTSKHTRLDESGKPLDVGEGMVALTEEGSKAIKELMEMESEVTLEGPQYTIKELEDTKVLLSVTEYESLKRANLLKE